MPHSRAHRGSSARGSRDEDPGGGCQPTRAPSRDGATSPTRSLAGTPHSPRGGARLYPVDDVTAARFRRPRSGLPGGDGYPDASERSSFRSSQWSPAGRMRKTSSNLPRRAVPGISLVGRDRRARLRRLRGPRWQSRPTPRRSHVTRLNGRCEPRRDDRVRAKCSEDLRRPISGHVIGHDDPVAEVGDVEQRLTYEPLLVATREIPTICVASAPASSTPAEGRTTPCHCPANSPRPSRPRRDPGHGTTRTAPPRVATTSCRATRCRRPTTSDLRSGNYPGIHAVATYSPGGVGSSQRVLVSIALKATSPPSRRP